MRFIRFLLEVSWRSIIIATVTGLVSGSGNALIISLINRSVNQAALPNALLYFAGLALFTLLTSTLSQFMLIQLSQNAIYQLRLKLSQNILFFTAASSGKTRRKSPAGYLDRRCTSSLPCGFSDSKSLYRSGNGDWLLSLSSLAFQHDICLDDRLHHICDLVCANAAGQSAASVFRRPR